MMRIPVVFGEEDHDNNENSNDDGHLFCLSYETPHS